MALKTSPPGTTLVRAGAVRARSFRPKGAPLPLTYLVQEAASEVEDDGLTTITLGQVVEELAARPPSHRSWGRGPLRGCTDGQVEDD